MKNLYTYIEEGLLQGMDQTLATGEEIATEASRLSEYLELGWIDCDREVQSNIEKIISTASLTEYSNKPFNSESATISWSGLRSSNIALLGHWLDDLKLTDLGYDMTDIKNVSLSDGNVQKFADDITDLAKRNKILKNRKDVGFKAYVAKSRSGSGPKKLFLQLCIYDKNHIDEKLTKRILKSINGGRGGRSEIALFAHFTFDVK